MRLLAFIAVIFAAPALAQNVTLTCTAPTANADGSVITGAISYKFYRGTTSTSQTTVSPIQSSCGYVWSGLPAGTHYFSATATVNGIESARSNVTSKTITATPNPPTNLTVQADTVAYETRYRWGRLTAWRDAGIAPAGTPCDAGIRISGTNLYSIPREVVVDLARPNRQLTAVVVAACG